MSTSKFDIGIVGGGVSGLHLALALVNDAYFKDYKIALFEKGPKTENDKTWSFWEDGKGKWDKLIYKAWSKGKIYAQNQKVDLQLNPYSYKMLRSIDFYTYAYQQLENASNVEVIYEAVVDISEHENLVHISTSESEYTSKLVFNSRIPDFNTIKNQADFTLLQHFKGWFIKTKKATFDPSEFTMMDYRYKDGDLTSFVYVLPVSENIALVEYTYFTPELVEDKTYDEFLKKYIQDQYTTDEYEIIDQEKGIIPMSNYNFDENHTEKIIQIGTAGGWVKASSGYSFKNAEKKAQKIVKNLKDNISPIHKLSHPKYKHYDTLFLNVLYENNHLGEKVFYKLYAKNNIQTLLRFLDEETNYVEDLSIIKSLTSIKFINAFFNHLFK
ncbi:lycopene cyclase family protein [Psychroflexus planctonicus]|uniref:Lycopene cyclase n=1 Tax=Psychroflexus planctonicus TaxID=1526575 RepID=A0ABQ1SGS1_9FLAO|nr:lycopene cyclase family protein [Psychroflexus planctonicus]GGE33180.1 lycopene cyclase [Psychroflexus planctonicus]